MRKYWHRSIDHILTYLSSQSVPIWLCSRTNPAAVKQAGVDDVRRLFELSQALFGLNSDLYVLSAPPPRDAGDLAGILEEFQRESRMISTDSVLIPYQDGGLISVSVQQLPFQRIEEEAPWWRLS